MSPFWRSVFLSYMGLVFITMSIKDGANAVYGDILLICIGALGGGFLTYGIIVFIGDIRKSKSISEFIDKIKNNIKRM